MIRWLRVKRKKLALWYYKKSFPIRKYINKRMYEIGSAMMRRGYKWFVTHNITAELLPPGFDRYEPLLAGDARYDRDGSIPR